MNTERCESLKPFLLLLKNRTDRKVLGLLLGVDCEKSKTVTEIAFELKVSYRHVRDVARRGFKRLELIKEQYEAKYGEGARPEL